MGHATLRDQNLTLIPLIVVQVYNGVVRSSKRSIAQLFHKYFHCRFLARRMQVL